MRKLGLRSSKGNAAISDMKFVLLHDAKGDDGVKAFFTELWELYIKVGAHWYRLRARPHQRALHFSCAYARYTDSYESFPQCTYGDP